MNDKINAAIDETNVSDLMYSEAFMRAMGGRYRLSRMINNYHRNYSPKARNKKRVARKRAHESRRYNHQRGK